VKGIQNMSSPVAVLHHNNYKYNTYDVLKKDIAGMGERLCNIVISNCNNINVFTR